MRMVLFATMVMVAALAGCDNASKPTDKDVADFVAPKLPAYLTIASTSATVTPATAADGDNLPSGSWHVDTKLRLNTAQPLSVPLVLSVQGTAAPVSVGEATSPELKSLAQNVVEATNLGQRDPARFAAAAQRLGVQVAAPSSAAGVVTQPAPQIVLPPFVKQTATPGTEIPAHLVLLAKPKQGGGWDFVNEQSDFDPAALGKPASGQDSVATNTQPVAVGSDAFKALDKKIADLDTAMKG